MAPPRWRTRRDMRAFVEAETRLRIRPNAGFWCRLVGGGGTTLIEQVTSLSSMVAACR